MHSFSEVSLSPARIFTEALFKPLSDNGMFELVGYLHGCDVRSSIPRQNLLVAMHGNKSRLPGWSATVFSPYVTSSQA